MATKVLERGCPELLVPASPIAELGRQAPGLQ